MNNFPNYINHDVVQCYNCGKILNADIIQSKYPTGVYVKRCDKCNICTFYAIRRKKACGGLRSKEQ